MKTKLLLLLATVITVVAYGKTSESNLYPFDYTHPKDETTLATNVFKLCSIYIVPSAPQAKETCTMPTSREFYEKLLDRFCRLYFKRFGKFKYKEGSIIITSPIEPDDDSMEIVGQYHYCRNNLSKWPKWDEEFRATVTQIDDNEYEVTFKRKSDLYGTDGWAEITDYIRYEP